MKSHKHQKISIKHFLQEIHPMPLDKASLIASFFKLETLKKGDFLFRQGEVSMKSYFIASGIVRSFITNSNNQQVTTRLYCAPIFFNDYFSFFKRKPSSENYEALSNCQIWGIKHEDSEYAFQNIPEYREWGRMLLIMNYESLNEQMLNSLKYSAKERYIHMFNNQPDIIQKVPLKIIASYLGITRYSLSRIRKEIIIDETLAK